MERDKKKKDVTEKQLGFSGRKALMYKRTIFRRGREIHEERTGVTQQRGR